MYTFAVRARSLAHNQSQRHTSSYVPHSHTKSNHKFFIGLFSLFLSLFALLLGFWPAANRFTSLHCRCCYCGCYRRRRCDQPRKWILSAVRAAENCSIQVGKKRAVEKKSSNAKKFAMWKRHTQKQDAMDWNEWMNDAMKNGKLICLIWWMRNSCGQMGVSRFIIAHRHKYEYT